MSFMSPAHVTGKTQASTISVCDWCRVAKPWWGSDPSFSFLLGHEGELPMGQQQASTQAGMCPHASTAVFSLTRLSPCISDAPGKGGSLRLPELTATGQSRGTKCIFHEQHPSRALYPLLAFFLEAARSPDKYLPGVARQLLTAVPMKGPSSSTVSVSAQGVKICRVGRESFSGGRS